jgi:hypothetical protein
MILYRVGSVNSCAFRQIRCASQMSCGREWDYIETRTVKPHETESKETLLMSVCTVCSTVRYLQVGLVRGLTRTTRPLRTPQPEAVSRGACGWLYKVLYPKCSECWKMKPYLLSRHVRSSWPVAGASSQTPVLRN